MRCVLPLRFLHLLITVLNLGPWIIVLAWGSSNNINKETELGWEGCKSFPLPVPFSSVPTPSIRADYGCLFFSYCKMLCDIAKSLSLLAFLKCHLIPAPVQYFLDFRPLFIPNTPLSFPPPLTSYRQRFRGSPTVPVYDIHWWQYFYRRYILGYRVFYSPTVRKFILSMILFPPPPPLKKFWFDWSQKSVKVPPL